ncbi:MAG TPA: hypothetical protein ENH29_06640 [Bacteroidetes bacterium]|nr:hypothetical protein [Bacteroidota bacterium]
MKKCARNLVRSIFLIFIWAVPLLSQPAKTEDPAILTVDRIFAANEFSPERFGPARWIDDGKGYTTLEKSAGITRGRDIVYCETKSGRRKILVPVKNIFLPRRIVTSKH